jgi:hypothetical protein
MRPLVLRGTFLFVQSDVLLSEYITFVGFQNERKRAKIQTSVL